MRLPRAPARRPQHKLFDYLAEVEGLEPPAVLPVTLFESALPAYSPHFRNQLTERDERIRSLYRIGVSFLNVPATGGLACPFQSPTPHRRFIGRGSTASPQRRRSGFPRRSLLGISPKKWRPQAPAGHHNAHLAMCAARKLKMLVPATGLEPAPHGLKGRCSAFELRRVAPTFVRLSHGHSQFAMPDCGQSEPPSSMRR